MKTTKYLFALLLTSLLVLMGCSKLNNANYSKIKIGMSYNEVTALIGNPKGCDDVLGVKTCKWGDDKQSVTINFAGDNVALHSAENLK